MIQEDHKILMTGCAGVTSATNFAFLRLLEDGIPDPSFGNGGGFQTDFQNNQDVAYTSILLPDGKYLVSGTARDSITNLDFALARYLHDGSPDLSFGNAGKRTYDLQGPVDDGLYMIQQPDHKFLVCGLSLKLGHNSFVIVRFNEDGSIDSNFGINGIASLDVGSILPFNTPSFAMQKDGKLVMVSNYKDGSNINFLTMRFTNDIVTKNEQPEITDNKVMIVPNPVRDEIRIQFKEISKPVSSIEIYNTSLQLILKQSIIPDLIHDGVYTLSAKDLNAGLHYARCNDGKSDHWIPFMILKN
jgi:uncharacterized delta-60 repeat protein